MIQSLHYPISRLRDFTRSSGKTSVRLVNRGQDSTYIDFICKAQVTLCRSGGPDLYDMKNREHRHGRLMMSWQHRTDILEVCSVGKRSAVIGKPVRQSFNVKLCRVGRDCGYDLFMERFQSCVEPEMSWDCRTQREGIRGQRVGIRGQHMDGREDRINITMQ